MKKGKVKSKPGGYWKSHPHNACGICSKPKDYRKKLINQLQRIGGLCDADCWGRCQFCPADVVNEVISLLEE